jgi:hypothetical protein
MNTLSNQFNSSKPKTIFEVLEFCKAKNLPARVVGKWVWVEFETKPAAEIRQALKDFGFHWSNRRQQWSHSCGLSSRPALSYRPWDKYRTISLDEACQNAGLGV